MSGRFMIRFTSGPLADRTFSIGPGEDLTFGSDPECAVHIENDPLVSRRHSVLRYKRFGIVLYEDLESTNGSLFNGRPFKKWVRVKPGDRITLGRLSTFQGSWWDALEPTRMHSMALLTRVSVVAARARREMTFSPRRFFTMLALVAATGVVLYAYRAEWHDEARQLLGKRREVRQALRAKPATGTTQNFVWDEIVNVSRRFGDAPPSAMDQDFLDEVEHWISEYTAGDGHKIMLRRRDPYWDQIQKTLRENGLPRELGYVVWVESRFDTRALSPAGARGLWQFTADTAREYGLKVGTGDGEDERLDPRKSTLAAARYFHTLLRMFGSDRYLLAIAAYNAGQNRVKRKQIAASIRRESRPDFWHLKDRLPEETVDYVPKVLAAIIIGRNLDRW